MNLVSNPWIPVVDRNGAHRWVSLHEAFAEGERIADLSANPCQRIALMRLLICIAQAALDGPANDAEWQTCQPHLAPKALTYLDRWQKRFNLFGEKAFLQVDGLEDERNALADKLDLTRVCGNTSTLLDQAATPDGRTPTPKKLALDLLTFQVYAPGGLISQLSWDGLQTVKSSESAPAIEGSLLHTYIRGVHLLETIHANLLAKTQQANWGKPAWELERLLRKDISANAGTYLGRLVPVSRAIRCIENSPQMTLAAAMPCPKHPEGREPAATVVLRKRGTNEVPGYVAVSLHRHPWRDLGSILSLSTADRKGSALALQHLRLLPEGVIDIWTGGLAADKSKLLDMAEWNFTLPKALLDEIPLRRYELGVELASRGESALRDAIKAYAEKLKAASLAWATSARSGYWGLLDNRSPVLTKAATQPDGDLAVWTRTIRDAMHAAYAQTCPHETPRQLQAYARGLKKLRLRQEQAER